MRKVNSILAILTMMFFLAHMIWGGLEITGLTKGGNPILRMLTHMMILFISLHMILSVILTAQTVRAWRKSGVAYFKQNRLFWIRRISGFALMFFIVSHVLIFRGNVSSAGYRLNYFGGLQLAAQILMVVCLLVHLCCNITPLRISLGIEDKKNIRTDVLLVLSILLLLAGIAFVIYYIRWSMV